MVKKLEWIGAVEQAREKYEVSERHACRLLGPWRRTQRYAAIQRMKRYRGHYTSKKIQ